MFDGVPIVLGAVSIELAQAEDLPPVDEDLHGALEIPARDIRCGDYVEEGVRVVQVVHRRISFEKEGETLAEATNVQISVSSTSEPVYLPPSLPVRVLRP